jgi:hypothetical protein
MIASLEPDKCTEQTQGIIRTRTLLYWLISSVFHYISDL